MFNAKSNLTFFILKYLCYFNVFIFTGVFRVSRNFGTISGLFLAGYKLYLLENRLYMIFMDSLIGIPVRFVQNGHYRVQVTVLKVKKVSQNYESPLQTPHFTIHLVFFKYLFYFLHTICDYTFRDKVPHNFFFEYPNVKYFIKHLDSSFV